MIIRSLMREREARAVQEQLAQPLYIGQVALLKVKRRADETGSFLETI